MKTDLGCSTRSARIGGRLLARLRPRRNGTLALVAAALVVWSMGPVLAGSISLLTSNSSVQTFRFPPQSDFDSFGPAQPCGGLRGCIDGTQAALDGNHISSFSGFGNGFMGAEFHGIGSTQPISAFTQSTYVNSWYCVVCDGPVGSGGSVNEFVPVQVLLSISGKAANITDASFVQLTAELDLSNGTRAVFIYAQDGTDPPGATLDLGQGSIPVDLVQDPKTGDWSFSVNASFTTLVCGPDFPCQPVGSPCFATDNCTGTPSFSDSQSITLQYDGEGNPFFLDALDPFATQLTTNDPNFQFASSDGQTTGPAVNTAEPGSLALLLGGVLGSLCVRQRARRPPAAAAVPKANCHH
jgi:hypothetical protein